MAKTSSRAACLTVSRKACLTQVLLVAVSDSSAWLVHRDLITDFLHTSYVKSQLATWQAAGMPLTSMHFKKYVEDSLQ